MKGPGALGIVALLALLGASAPAQAALKLCNRTSYIVYAATGLAGRSSVKTQGWTRIVPGACEIALPGDLSRAAPYVYARTAQAHGGPAHAWGGNVPLCVEDTNFAAETPFGLGRCTSDDRFLVPFAAIPVNGRADWTSTFTQIPALATLDAAREAGLVRLLGDAGLLNPAAANRRRAFDKALDTFRTRMKMPRTASAADLFDALETEALKVAAPAGYSICNDTDEPLWAAIGLKTTKAWASRGWWKVMPGACAHALTAALANDRIYLLAERKDGRRLVAGKETFCITQIGFDVERRTQCKERGLVAAGFAPTGTRGHTGYAAHIGENGLLPTLRPED